MDGHSELEAEQAHLDRAYERLDELRARTQELLASVLGQSRGGTPQFREERDVLVRTSLARLEQLDVGDQPLCFGRIDRMPKDGTAGQHFVESFHIGRLGVSSEDQEPLVVDWRAPVAEPFYRATGRDPMGLVLRRHIAAAGRRVTGIEDERFAAEGRRNESSLAEAGLATVEVSSQDTLSDDLEHEIGGPGALLAALSGARSGYMRDIVSTIQGEQDEIIRAALPGVLVVEGGPGTGKTAVALHRAAYLLYTHRFPLERQGVLVIGPNPLFLRYIEHVLPSLGESGVTLSTVNGLVHGVQARAQEPPGVGRLKGDPRMAQVIARAVRDRQRPLRRDARIPWGSANLRLSAEASAAVISAARRRPGTHNGRRRFVEQLVARRLADEYLRTLSVHDSLQTHDEALRLPLASVGSSANGSEPSPADSNGNLPEDPAFDFSEFSRHVLRVPALNDALDRMWPRLSAEELVHDLYGSRPLVSLAAKGLLDAKEQGLLLRPRAESLGAIPWTAADLALVDEARVLLGPRKGRPADGSGPVDPGEAPRTYGHIVVDEAQDLSPMQLRMVSRRSLSGSITVVGDIAQATGPWAPGTWEDVTAHLPANRAPRVMGLTVSYRTPAEVVEVAARVLANCLPGFVPPTPARRTGVQPAFELVPAAALSQEVARLASAVVSQTSPGTTAVLAPPSLVGELAATLDSTGVESSDPRSEGLGAPLSLLPVDLANGLEFDAVIVVEPSSIVAESAQGPRALYMALTRPTRRLAVVHSAPLPF